METKNKSTYAHIIPLVPELKAAGDVMFEHLASLAGLGVSVPDGIKEAMSTWARLSTQLEKEDIANEQG